MSLSFLNQSRQCHNMDVTPYYLHHHVLIPMYSDLHFQCTNPTQMWYSKVIRFDTWFKGAKEMIKWWNKHCLQVLWNSLKKNHKKFNVNTTEFGKSVKNSQQYFKISVFYILIFISSTCKVQQQCCSKLFHAKSCSCFQFTSQYFWPDKVFGFTSITLMSERFVNGDFRSSLMKICMLAVPQLTLVAQFSSVRTDFLKKTDNRFWFSNLMWWQYVPCTIWYVPSKI